MANPWDITGVQEPPAAGGAPADPWAVAGVEDPLLPRAPVPVPPGLAGPPVPVSPGYMGIPSTPSNYDWNAVVEGAKRNLSHFASATGQMSKGVADLGGSPVQMQPDGQLTPTPPPTSQQIQQFKKSAQTTLVPFSEGEPEPFYRGILQGAESLLSPQNISIGLAAWPLSTAARLAQVGYDAVAIRTLNAGLGAYFALQMAGGASQNVEEAKAAYDRGDLDTVAQKLGAGTIQGILAGLGLYHAGSNLREVGNTPAPRLPENRTDIWSIGHGADFQAARPEVVNDLPPADTTPAPRPQQPPTIDVQPESSSPAEPAPEWAIEKEEPAGPAVSTQQPAPEAASEPNGEWQVVAQAEPPVVESGSATKPVVNTAPGAELPQAVGTAEAAEPAGPPQSGMPTAAPNAVEQLPVTPNVAGEAPEAEEAPGADVVQRFEAPGEDRADFSRPQGIYTTPGRVESPHADLGGERFLWRKNPDANVLSFEQTQFRNDDLVIRPGAASAGAGIWGLRHLVGQSAFDALRGMRTDALRAKLSAEYPEVDWKRGYDSQELLEQLGGILARKAGYDAIELTDKTDPRFSEYVGLTPRSMTPIEAPGADASGEEDLEALEGEHPEPEAEPAAEPAQPPAQPAPEAVGTAQAAEPSQPSPEEQETLFRSEYEKLLTARRKEAGLDLDEDAIKATIGRLTLRPDEKHASAQVGERSGRVEKQTEKVGRGKRASTKTVYRATFFGNGQPRSFDFDQPDRAAYWLTDQLYQIGGREVHLNGNYYGGGKFSESLLRTGSLLNNQDRGYAAAEAAANAIGRPELRQAIYQGAYYGGAYGTPLDETLAEVRRKHSEHLPANESALTERTANEKQQRLLGTSDPNKGYSDWEQQLEDYERTAKGLLRNLESVRERFETAKIVNGGPHPEITKREKTFEELEANIHRNLAFVRERVQEELAKHRDTLEPRVRAQAEGYAQFGEAAIGEPGKRFNHTTPEQDRARYAKLAGIENTWPAILAHFGIKEQAKPERLALPAGKDKLVKEERGALAEISLLGDSYVSSPGARERFQKRGWADADGKLTELGKRAVYSIRLSEAEGRAGKPFSEYTPGKGVLPAPGESRFGNGSNFWAPVQGEVWHSDGRGAWKGEFPKNWPKRDETKPGPNISAVLPKEKGKTVKPVGFTETRHDNDLQHLIFFDNGSAMAGTLFDYTNKLLPGLQWTQTKKTDAFQAWKDGKRVAVVMPVRAEVVPEKLAGLVKDEAEKKPAETKPKTEDIERAQPWRQTRAEWEKERRQFSGAFGPGNPNVTDIRQVKPKRAAGSQERVMLPDGSIWEYKGISGYAADNRGRVNGWENITSDILRVGDHREAVRKALAAGLPVPEEVLADYPDLRKKREGDNSVTLGSGLGALQPYVDKFLKADVAPHAKQFSELFGLLKHDFLKVFAPAAVDEFSKAASLSIRHRAAELQRATDRAQAALAIAEKYFSRLPDEARFEFIARMEDGRKQADPALDPFAETMRQILDSRREAIRALGKGKLQHFIENYFPHIWKKPGAAADFYANATKRPLQGSKAFLKQRTIDSFAAGLEAGLEPISTNPVELVLRKAREMDKYLAGQKILDDLKQQGLLRYVDARDSKIQTALRNAGFVPINDPSATIYGPSVQPITEYPNEGLWTALEQVIEALGIQHKRGFLKLRGGAIGTARKGGGINTLHGTAEDVVAHEIGHQIDFLAGSGKRFIDHYPDQQTVERIKRARKALKDTKQSTLEERRAARKELEALAPAIQQRKKFAKELRDLADLRSGPTDYTHKREEKMAQLAEMWVGARELFERTAPTVFKEWKAFLDANEKLHALRDIEGNTEVKALAQPYDVGGLVIKGYWWAPEAAARVVNNYLSPGLREKFGSIRAAMSVANVLNQAQLGFSGFHAVFTTLESSTSKLALALYQAAHGDVVKGLKSAALSPVAPITTFARGNQMKNEWFAPGTQGEFIGQLVEAMMRAGGRAHMDAFYRTHIAKRMVEAWREGNVLGALARVPGAVFEIPTRLIMEELVPRLKLGAFADLAQYELERLPADATFEEAAAALSKAWDSIDNRFGQLVYDNLFWHKYVKDIALLTVRSPGWNVGDIRELAGGYGDTGRALIEAAKKGGGKNGRPQFTHRMAYIPAHLLIAATLGALLYYIWHGTAPKHLKDYFFPTDNHGKRWSPATYVRDEYNWQHDPARTAAGKINPFLRALTELATNRDYRDKQIIDTHHHRLPAQLQDLGEYLGKQFLPLWAEQMSEKHEHRTLQDKLLPEFGITRAPKSLDHPRR